MRGQIVPVRKIRPPRRMRASFSAVRSALSRNAVERQSASRSPNYPPRTQVQFFHARGARNNILYGQNGNGAYTAAQQSRVK